MYLFPQSDKRGIFIQEGVDLCAVTGKNYLVVIQIWENNETDI